MTKIWGFDIGTSSLGWSVIAWDEAKPGEVIAAGVRCFEEPIEPKSKASKAIARRTARGMRRNLGRRSERKRAVMDLLQESQMTSSDLLAWRSLDVYQLRAKAIDERLTLAELGRVLLHLSQRRGFQSNRKSALSETGIPEVDSLIEESERRSLIRQEAKAAKKGGEAEAEEGIVLSSITRLHEEMEEAGSRTLGSHLNTLINQGEHARRRHTHRAQHHAEFDAIWVAQSQHYPQKLTDALKARFFQALYFQRPLKIQTGLRADCRLEPGRKAAPKAHHLFQRLRVLAVLNNIKIEAPGDLNGRRLAPAEIETIYARLKEAPELTWAKFRTLLKLPKNIRINLESSPEHTKLKGSITDIVLQKATEGAWMNWPPEKQNEIMTLCLLPGSDKQRLDALINQGGLAPVIAYQIVTKELPSGVGAYSEKALKMLVPQLERGLQLYDAQIAAGYTPLHEQDQEHKDKLTLDDIPIVRNPSVNKAIHEARKLANALMREHGRPDLIRIELVRELALGPKDLARMEKSQKAGKDANEKAEKAAQAHGIVNPSRMDRIKHRLWEECGGVCPYTGQSIPLSRLWTKDWEIEHILPFSLSLDTSMKNLTLCPSEVNQAKGARTAAEFFQGRPQDWQAACDRVDAWKVGRHKKQLWRKVSTDIDEQFIARQLTDTSYAARELRDMMAKLAPVETSSGRLTADLRHKWGLNTLLSESGKKVRDNHLHHALDAVVIALSTRAYVKRISSAHKRADGRSELRWEAPLPWPELRGDVERALGEIIVSHEPRHKMRGALHEDTGYGRRGGKFVTRKAIESLTAGEVERVVDPGLRRHLREAIEREGDLKKALAAPFEIYDRHGVAHVVRRALITSKKQNADVFVETKTAHYVGGNNYACLILERADGSRTAQVVKLFDARQAMLAGRGLESFAPPGTRILFALRKNDMVELGADEPGIYVVKGFSPEGKAVDLVLQPHSYSGVEKSKQVRLRSNSAYESIERLMRVTMLGVE